MLIKKKGFVLVRLNTISVVIASVMMNSIYQHYACKQYDSGHAMSVTMSIRLWLQIDLWAAK